jgi:hypothetical protein
MAGSEKRASRTILEGLLGTWLRPGEEVGAAGGGSGVRAEARNREALAAAGDTEATASERWADSQCKAADVDVDVENDGERARGSWEHRPSKLSHAEAAQYLRQWPGHRALCPPRASAELGPSIEIAAAKPPAMTREQRLELAARKKAEFEARRWERERAGEARVGAGAPAPAMFQTASQLHKMR